MSDLATMKAYRLRPEDVYQERRDSRDIYTADRACAMLHELEAEHAASFEKRLDWDSKAVKELYRRWWAQINVLSGGRGDGKTLVAIFIAALFFARGHYVFSNIGARFGYVLEGASIYGIARLPPNSIILLDEGHVLFNKWSQMTQRQRSGVGGIANLHKRMLSVVMPTSQEHNLGSDLMAELGYIFYPRQKKAGQRTKRSRTRGGQARGRGDYISYPWANLSVPFIGPRPVRGKFLGEEYGIRVGGPRPRRRRWFPPAVELERAAALYSSYVDIPTRLQAGTNVSSRDIAAMDMDGEFELFDDALEVGDDGTVDADLERLRQQYDEILGDFIGALMEDPLPKGSEEVSAETAWGKYRQFGDADRAAFDEMLVAYLDVADGAIGLAQLTALFADLSIDAITK